MLQKKGTFKKMNLVCLKSFKKEGEHTMRRKQTMSLKLVKFDECYRLFIDEKIALGISDQTLATYKLHIENFLKLTEAGNLAAGSFNADFWNYYLTELKEDEGKKDVTVTSYARSIRVFLYWCMDNDYINSMNLKLPKYKKTVKEVYTGEEIQTLLEKPVKPFSEVTYQTWVFINLIMSTGLRLSSALDLTVSDYVRKEQILYVQNTKQKMGQKLYLNDDVCNIINKYIREFDLDDNDYLFCTANRGRMARRTMEDNVATYNRSRGVIKTSIHLMRHTFAKNYYQNSKDVYGLQQILGHSQISTTEHYLRGLGVDSTVTSVYNPQQQFGRKKEENQKKRRSRKMK